ncbi:MAG: hypothetical protein K0Q57_1033 [Gammaproteobacteria bacterium]|jgi:hypothetical protein|nr:hypothetical protein [Gammaproteobacteria bacterium]
MRKALLAVVALAGLGLGLTACHQGPAASAGESVDHATSQVTNAVKNATGTSGPAERAGQKVDNATYNATH